MLAEPTTEKILNNIREQEDSSNEDHEEPLVNSQEESVSYTDALNAITKLRAYLGSTASITETLYKNVDEVESFVMQRLCHTHQKKFNRVQPCVVFLDQTLLFPNAAIANTTVGPPLFFNLGISPNLLSFSL